MERRLKRNVVISLYVLGALAFCLGLYFIENGFTNKLQEETTYVDKVILDKDEPVVKNDDVLSRPYNLEGIEILNSFYDISSDENSQQNSIIYYNNTYIQNSGVIYGSDSSFDVLAIYDGEVIKVEDTDLLGKVVEIRHSNDIVSIYQLLDSTNVTIGSLVNKGEKIGTSGLSNILNNNKHKLYFELALRGQLVNPEVYYGKKLGEI